MWITLFVHVLAGGLALGSGYVALYAAKGARLHRRSGMVFTYAMLAMSGLGIAIALLRNAAPAVNVPAGSLTAYLVTTALSTVRPRSSRALDLVGLIVALALGFICLAFGFQAVSSAGGTRNGIPAFPFFLFGFVATCGAIGDIRLLRAGTIGGTARLARHLWRMCFALLIAALAFFLGQAKVIPAPLRIPGLLALPILAVLATMLYWLWRVRIRQSLRGIAVDRT